ncbi:MAG: hypothetical protein COV02_02020 [Candidatus Terrybacteria bacterium CG10_big_fil_rev_8_21_14_0_10_41_10]|uniref:Bacterial sugar transferase domain-containing protein n=1 Tax=Candidatus Terrybacteria bacterium CG10_big_fil_rev_8_21_14_0_10_41_10 TaxID=1975026 RepID=A0A2M8LAB6_9BACT|nr:MAG: hypothetical protein COV02_02020 [Candidatus Terrybacteria bacterium CG10_big_fil_rev_8_21_14_0_10_41_10]
MIKTNRSIKTILFIGDVLLLFWSLLATLSLRYWGLPGSVLWENHKWPFFFVNALWIVIFYIAGLYDLGKITPNSKILYIFKTMLVAAGVAVLMFYFVPNFNITPKTNLLIDAVIASITIWLWRKAIKKFILKSSKIKIFFIGETKEVSEFADFVKDNPQFGYKVLDSASHADVIVTPANARQDGEIITTLYDMILKGKTIVDFDRFYESITGKIPVSTINKVWFLENLIEINKQKFEIIKRWLDVMLAIILFIPYSVILPFVATLIKLTSKGDIFYKQKRIGKNNKTFEIIKFRTMLNNAEKNGAVWADKNDKRITFFGNILRKTRIDELPQLCNVLNGELSFIGPRPERPEFIKDLTEKIPHYSMRHLVKPGLSGWAQVNYPYGASVDDANKKLQYDLYYVKNRSFALELSIALKTILTLLKREGR